MSVESQALATLAGPLCKLNVACVQQQCVLLGGTFLSSLNSSGATGTTCAIGQAGTGGGAYAAVTAYCQALGGDVGSRVENGILVPVCAYTIPPDSVLEEENGCLQNLGTWNAATQTCTYPSISGTVAAPSPCHPGWEWNAARRECAPCPPGMTSDGTHSCTTPAPTSLVPSLTGGSHALVRQGLGALDPDPSPSPLTAERTPMAQPLSFDLLSSAAKVGVGAPPTCNPGWTWNAARGECSPCPPGQTSAGGACFSSANPSGVIGGTPSTQAQCVAVGGTWYPSTGLCVTGQRFGSDATIASAAQVGCNGGGGTWNPFDGTCSCPAGTSWNAYSNACTPALPPPVVRNPWQLQATLPALQHGLRGVGTGAVSTERVLTTVRPGETTASIAFRTGMSPEELLAYNPTKARAGYAGGPGFYALVAGEQLIVPASHLAAGRPDRYTVLPGDTTRGIAQKLGLTVGVLLSMNPTLRTVTIPGVGRVFASLVPGQKLWVPISSRWFSPLAAQQNARYGVYGVGGVGKVGVGDYPGGCPEGQSYSYTDFQCEADAVTPSTSCAAGYSPDPNSPANCIANANSDACASGISTGNNPDGTPICVPVSASQGGGGGSGGGSGGGGGGSGGGGGVQKSPVVTNPPVTNPPATTTTNSNTAKYVAAGLLLAGGVGAAIYAEKKTGKGRKAVAHHTAKHRR